jgi:hypothetical protein
MIARSSGAHDCGEGTDMGDMQDGRPKRAVGTRDRVMRFLTAAGEISDPHGMASTALADAIGYPGSSIAFAQLLSGMEKSGLIERDVRGKRTYLITPVAVPAGTPDGPGTASSPPRPSRRRPGQHGARQQGATRPPGASQHGHSGRGPSQQGPSQQGPSQQGPSQARGGAVAGAEDFDYDELARRLLIQVVQRLAAAPPDGREQPAPLAVAGAPATGTSAAGTGAGGAVPGPKTGSGGTGAAAGSGDATLARTVASLEHKLASVRTKQRKLTEENAKLREQLRAAQESLVRAQEHADSGRIAGQLDSAEAGLLERLLSPLRDRGDRHEEAGAG